MEESKAQYVKSEQVREKSFIRETKHILLNKNDSEISTLKASCNNQRADIAVDCKAPITTTTATLFNSSKRQGNSYSVERSTYDTSLSNSLESQLRQLIIPGSSSQDNSDEKRSITKNLKSLYTLDSVSTCVFGQQQNVPPQVHPILHRKCYWSLSSQDDKVISRNLNGSTSHGNDDLQHHLLRDTVRRNSTKPSQQHKQALQENFDNTCYQDERNHIIKTDAKSLRFSSISRSKSDIGHRTAQKGPKNIDDLDRFFATIGLDSSTWAAMTQNESLTSTPTRFFDSIESVDSAKQLSTSPNSSLDDGAMLKRSLSQHQTVSTTSHNCGQTPKKQLTLSSSLSSYGLTRETSIVEKNARVIKWLYNCNKAFSADEVK